MVYSNMMKLKHLAILSAGVCFLFLLSIVPTASVNAYSATASSGYHGSVAVGSDPVTATYNWNDGYVWVADKNSNHLSVITSGSNPTVLSYTPVTGNAPWGITATGSTCNNEVAVSNSGSGSVSLISSKSPFNTITTISIPSVMSNYKTSVPYGITYASGYLYVADGVGQIDVINCHTNTLVGSVGLTPFSTLVGAYYDWQHKIVYFSDPGYGAIWYFDLSGNEPSCAVPSPCIVSEAGDYVAAPAYFTLDKANGMVYLSDSTDNTIRSIAVVDKVPQVTATGYGNFSSHELYAPTGIAYDPDNGMVLAANSGGKYEVTAICVATTSSFCKSAGIGGFQEYSEGTAHGFGMTYDWSNGYVYVTNHNDATVSFVD